MMIGRKFRGFGLSCAGLALLAAVPAKSQDDSAEERIERLESEVRALQRKVFPGGDGRYFEPQITGQPAQRPTVDAPSTTAVTDILARLDALEGQIQRLTGQGEESANALRLLTERVEVLEGGGAATEAVSGNPGAVTGATPAVPAPAASGLLPSPKPAQVVPASMPAPAAAPSAERLAAVQAIAKPQTDDAGDDEYSYGFRLWDAGFYPEAQQQLTMFVEKYPDHWRTTYGRNLLGRAYLDGGKAREAAPWFLRNYQTDKSGERAGDSLLYLAEAMIALKDTGRACIALAEFGETYPALAAGRLQDEYASNRAKVTCN